MLRKEEREREREVSKLQAAFFQSEPHLRSLAVTKWRRERQGAGWKP